MKDVWPIVLFLLLVVGFAVAMLLTGDWLRRRRLAKKYPPVQWREVDFQLSYRFEFTSTKEDLLQAFEAERKALSGLRRTVRWCVVGMGYAWLLGAIVFWRKASALQLTAWIALGIGVLWKDVVKPFWKRRHIRASVAASQEVAFEFTDNAIRIEALGVGTFNRAWDELDGAINSDEGVLIYFNDGTINWLPRRVFPNDVTKRAFHYHLLQRLPDAQTEDDSLQQD